MLKCEIRDSIAGEIYLGGRLVFSAPHDILSVIMTNVSERENINVFNPNGVVEDLRTGERGNFVQFEMQGDIRYARFQFPSYAALLPEGLVASRISIVNEEMDIDPTQFVEHPQTSEDTEQLPGLERAQIIDDITVFNGLRPAALLTRGNRQHFTSADPEENNYLYTVILLPKMNEYDIQSNVLSRGSETIFHVLGERNSDPSDDEMEENQDDWEQIINQRQNASFLVVIPLAELLARTKRNMRYAYYPGVVNLNIPAMDTPVVQISDAILPYEISHLIFPTPVLEEYKRFSRHFSDTKAQIIEVGQTYGEKDSWRVYDPHFDVPDYFDALYRLSQNITTPHLVHGVRLPLDSEVVSDATN